MRTRMVLSAVIATISLFVTAKASAIDVPNSITAPPIGAGTERPSERPAGQERMREGPEAAINVGGGFTDTYGFGLGGRVGYTLAPGLYLGGNVGYYFGHSITTAAGTESAHAMFIGAEAGYKLYPAHQSRWEVRPYVLAGPSFTKTVEEAPFRSVSSTRFAFAPGVLAAYHFGNMFLSGEGRLYITEPGALSILAGAGMAF